MKKCRNVDFKIIISSVVNNKQNIGSLLEDQDRQNAIEKADIHINELLNKKTWTAQDAGKIYFYDYLVLINEKYTNQLYKQRRSLITKKLKQFCNSYKSDEKIYKLYSDLFRWLITVYHKGFIFLQQLNSSYKILSNIIDNACSAELIAKESFPNLSNNAQVGLCSLMLEDTIYNNCKECKTKKQDVEDTLSDLKTSINNLTYYRLTLDIVGEYAGIQELKFFSLESKLFVLINKLVDKISKLKNIIYLNKHYNAEIVFKKNKIIKSILIDKLQLKELIPLKDELIDGTCCDNIYKNGFDISIKIDYERKTRRF
jgi:hypothetical protein